MFHLDALYDLTASSATTSPALPLPIPHSNGAIGALMYSNEKYLAFLLLPSCSFILSDLHRYSKT